MGDDRRRARRHRRHRQRGAAGRTAARRGDDRSARRCVDRSCSPGRSRPRAGPGTRRAPVCPGSLDAARTAGAVVVCERGGNRPPREVDRGRAGRRRRDGPRQRHPRWPRPRPPRRADGPPRPRRRPRAHPLGRSSPRAARSAWCPRRHGPDRCASPRGRRVATPPAASSSPTSSCPRPACSPRRRPARSVAVAGRMLNGTSAASARTAGDAAVLLARHGWPAGVVRSALATSAAPVAGGALRTGSGPGPGRRRAPHPARLRHRPGRLPGLAGGRPRRRQHPVPAAAR